MKSSSSRLSPLFRTLASLSVAAGCGTSSSPPIHTGDGPKSSGTVGENEAPAQRETLVPTGADGSESTESAPGEPDALCDAQHQYLPLDGVTTALPVDYLELRARESATEHALVASRGRACATAKDAARCMASLAKLEANDGWWKMTAYPDGAAFYLAYTRGDEIGMVTSEEALARFLAPIENAKDAALIVQYLVHCVDDHASVSARGVTLTIQENQGCGARSEHVIKVSASGKVESDDVKVISRAKPHCVVGRRPEGYALSTQATERTLAAHFAEIAELEAASVYAFERLVRELIAHAAPDEITRAAHAAAWDEVRHARITGSLAKRFGGSVRAPEVAEQSVRSLFEMARENATEGCVRETFGALQASVEARQAKDPAIARAMSVIAEDETRHAALAWDVAAWIDTLLTPEERVQVAEAREEAIAELMQTLALHEPAAEVSALAGVPGSSQAMWLVAQAREQLWARA